MGRAVFPPCCLTWGQTMVKVMKIMVQFSSFQFSRSAVSSSLRPHESQHARPPCPSPTPRVCPDSHPSSQWCHPAISSSVVPFASCPQCLQIGIVSSQFTDKIPGLGISPGEGKGYPLQYSGLENSMDCIVHGVRSQRVRHDWATFTFICWTIWK